MKKYLFFLPFFSSCSILNYTPSLQNVPLFEKKGEISILGGFDNNSKIGLQLATSLGNHIAIQYSNNFKINDKEYLNEGGLGYYSKVEDIWVVESYFGYGEWNKYELLNNEKIGLKFNRYYIQPSCGIISKYIDVALTTKFSRIKYYIESDNYLNSNNLFNTEKVKIVDSEGKRYYLLEPGVTIRVGYKYFKIQYQYFSDISYYIKKNNVHSVSLFFKIPLLK